MSMDKSWYEPEDGSGRRGSADQPYGGTGNQPYGGTGNQPYGGTGNQPDGGQPPGTSPYGSPPPGSGPGHQPYGPPPGSGGWPGSRMEPSAERTWSMGAHLSALIGLFTGLAFLGPLVVMLVQGPKSPMVRAHSVEALNFNLSVLIYELASFVLAFVLIGLLLLPIVAVAWIVLTILAAVRANSGVPYRYPLTIRFVS